jgi:hypothetical protein
MCRRDCRAYRAAALGGGGAFVTLHEAGADGSLGAVELHLAGAVKQGGRHGRFDEVVGTGVAIRVPGNRKPPLLYESTQAALEVALAFMKETFHVKLG